MTEDINNKEQVFEEGETPETKDIDPILAKLQQEERFDVKTLVSMQLNYNKKKKQILEKYQEYPKIIEALQKSFQTPQIGPHHTEGPTMEAHLALILHTIEELAAGKVHTKLQDPELADLLIRTVQTNKEAFQEYAFLHDIAKPMCMRLSFEKKEGEELETKEITWEEWKEIEKKGEPYTSDIPQVSTNITELKWSKKKKSGTIILDAREDVLPQLKEIPKGAKITLNPSSEKIKISKEKWDEMSSTSTPFTHLKEGKKSVLIKSMGYFHKSKGTKGNHGNVGMDFLEQEMEEEQLPQETIRTAVRMHETAFQEFPTSINAEKFEQSYGHLSNKQFAFSLVASYIDFAGSLKEDGDPEFGPLLNVMASKRNGILMESFKVAQAEFRDNDYRGLITANNKLSIQDIEKKRVKTISYKKEDIEPAIAMLNLEAAEKEKIIELLVSEPENLGKEMGKALGKKMNLVRATIANLGTDPFKKKLEEIKVKFKQQA